VKGDAMTKESERSVEARRSFLGKLGLAAAACAGAATLASIAPAVARATSGGSASFPTKDYDWTRHKWAFGVDANKCIGCLRCVEACKTENSVPGNPHQFRTWVERYVYLEGVEGETRAHIDSQQDPVNIAAAGAPNKYRFANRYANAKVDKAFFVPKLCNQCEHPACVQVCPVGATYQTKDGVVLIDEKHCIGCRYCVQACPYGARYFNEEKGVPDKCNWCYHRITKGLQPACVDACPVGARVFGNVLDRESPISLFIRNNRVQVLRPESGNSPRVFYVGIDKEVS
jgi:Fe-S-cluster-containing dehydrogenase component